MKNGLICLTILAVIQLTSCSSIRKTGLGIASPMFVDALPAMEKEGVWERFKLGTPANLKLAEGLLATDNENEDLLLAVIKGYAGYGYGVYETQYMVEKYADSENSHNRIFAINTYLRSFQYGLKLLELNDITFDDLKKRINNTGDMKAFLEDNLSNDARTREGVLFAAQSLASLINLQRDNMVLVSYLPIPKALFDWVCQKDPGIAYGTCAIFYGSYEAGRPAMLGGNPSKGKEIFEKALSQYPHNWLVRIAYLENYIVPMLDEDLYAREKKIMKNYVKLFQKELVRFPEEKVNEHFNNPHLKVYQAIAIKRFEAIIKNEENIF